jgi:hypothetical protein
MPSPPPEQPPGQADPGARTPGGPHPGAGATGPGEFSWLEWSPLELAFWGGQFGHALVEMARAERVKLLGKMAPCHPVDIRLSRLDV